MVGCVLEQRGNHGVSGKGQKLELLPVSCFRQKLMQTYGAVHRTAFPRPRAPGCAEGDMQAESTVLQPLPRGAVEKRFTSKTDRHDAVAKCSSEVDRILRALPEAPATSKRTDRPPFK